MNQEFIKRKTQVVSSLVEYLDPERRDKSPKGFIDEPILDLMHVINQHSDYYTTSSCSGRVAIYCPGLEENKVTTKGGIWLYVSHDPIEIPQNKPEEWIVPLLFGERPVVFGKQPADILQKQLVYFKFEPLILHIEASSSSTAMHLLNVANQVGYQNSGITPSRRHMLAIRSTLKIDTPVAYIEDDTVHSLVDPSYLLLLLHMSNEKFQQNIDRMKIFENRMREELTAKPVWESKEERSERKRKEGLMQRESKPKKEEIIEDVDMSDVFQ